MIFNIAVEAAAIPVRIVPAVVERRSPAASPIAARTAPIAEARAVPRTPVAVVAKRIFDVPDLAAIDAVAEVNDHRRALCAGRRRVAASLQLLGDDPRVALKLQAAVRGHPVTRHDDESLPLRCRHRLIARYLGAQGGGAGRQGNGRNAERGGGEELP